MKRLVEQLEKTAPQVYPDASSWKFVALVGFFVSAYVALAIAGVAIPPELAGLAGTALGVSYGRTFKRMAQ